MMMWFFPPLAKYEDISFVIMRFHMNARSSTIHLLLCWVSQHLSTRRVDVRICEGWGWLCAMMVLAKLLRIPRARPRVKGFTRHPVFLQLSHILYIRFIAHSLVCTYARRRHTCCPHQPPQPTADICTDFTNIHANCEGRNRVRD